MRRERLIRPTCAIPQAGKTRQALHPALPPGVFFLNPTQTPHSPFPFSPATAKLELIDHITIILHTGQFYELPVAVRPLDLGFTTLKNRVLMGSMHRDWRNTRTALNGWQRFMLNAPSRRGADCQRRYCTRFNRRCMEGGAMLNDASQIPHHRTITKPYIRKAAKSPCKFCIPGAQLPTASGRSFRIAGSHQPFRPHELSHEEILQLIDNFARCGNWRGRPDTMA